MINLYQSCYDLIERFVFGGEIVLNSHADLIATLLSSCACILLVAFPFVIVWKVLKMLIG